MAENFYQGLGRGLRQFGGDVQEFDDQMTNRRMLMEQAVQRRVEALRAQRQAEEAAQARQEEERRRQWEFEQDQAKADREAKTRENLEKFREKAAGTPGEARPLETPPDGEFGPQKDWRSPLIVPGSAERQVPSRDELQRDALSLGVYQDPGVKEYFEDTKPRGNAGITYEERAKLEQLKEDLRRGRPLSEHDKAMMNYLRRKADYMEASLDRINDPGAVETQKIEGRNLANVGKVLIQGLRPLPDAYITNDDVKEIKQAKYVFDSVKSGIGTLMDDYNRVGAELWGKDAAAMETTIRNIQLQMKEFYNLGVLNGPDLALMEQQLPNVTELRDASRDVAMGTFRAKVNRLSRLLEDSFSKGLNVRGFEYGEPIRREPARDVPPKRHPGASTKPPPAARDFGKEYDF